MENNWSKLMLLFKNVDRDDTLLEKLIFNNLLDERTSELNNLKYKIDPNNLTYKFKAEGISSKDFRSY